MVESAPDGHLDLWARGHYKSTIITYAKTIQDILASHGEDPLFHWRGLQPTFVIFSHTRPIAKAFMRQIKYEFERNTMLKELFPDVLWSRPESQSPRWSEDAGLVVKRASNPKEGTIEAWGLVDGQPISKHWDVMLYDDVVVRESVSTPEMIAKTTEMWELSLNLGSTRPIHRYIGTRYHHADTYADMMRRGAAAPRLYPATDDGTLTGNPVFLEPDMYQEKVRFMGPYTASAQLLQNPTADNAQGFRREWLRHFSKADGYLEMNRALLVDAASEKKRGSDWTAIAIVAKGPDRNYYALDWIRDRLNLEERAQAVMRMHRKWRPQVVGYEKYGMMADVEYLKQIQERDNYRFFIQELGGKMPKHDRIRRLVPAFSEGQFYLPTELHYTQYDGRTVDLVETFINDEMMPFPVGGHDDVLDAFSRVYDVDLTWPKAAEELQRPRRYGESRRRTSWRSV
jgi:predicted phage terminase large subunit-like protein